MMEARVEIVEGTFRSLRARAPGLTCEVARQFGERFHCVRDADVEFFPGALETLDELRSRGVRLALITNGQAEAQRGKIEKFDLARRFEHIQIEGELGFGKPDERAYRHALTALNVSPAQCWIVGDNLEWEVAAPQRIGIYAVWLDSRRVGLPAGSTVRPDRTVRLISELLEPSLAQIP